MPRTAGRQLGNTTDSWAGVRAPQPHPQNKVGSSPLSWAAYKPCRAGERGSGSTGPQPRGSEVTAGDAAAKRARHGPPRHHARASPLQQLKRRQRAAHTALTKQPRAGGQEGGGLVRCSHRYPPWTPPPTTQGDGALLQRVCLATAPERTAGGLRGQVCDPCECPLAHWCLPPVPPRHRPPRARPGPAARLRWGGAKRREGRAPSWSATPED
ncbi:hypothetical protein GWK47_026295 [Chionoecetes opilio]|uniref:Uncharacterized protein n=1 Tax=Chionoecetes opilio TaxID=41210 RepID=A0A8J8WMR3_CHIOP|nr:hypothetical protein GWK47_026295 [Chionoecetes opilio]